MRALRVLGIAENGTQVVCQPVVDAEDTAVVSAVETFTLPVDERLRAAVRGDLTRIGQLEIEMESQLRPREIQQRIRAGSTVEQVAAAAGCSPERIERYAYPVLLERSTIAERARLAHPVIDGVVAGRPLQDVVADTLAARGQQAALTWDAFRDDRGWAVRAIWKAGRSENRATWSYHAGPAGGTVIARDDSALMLVDPAQQSLRTVGVVGAVGVESRSPAPSGRRTAAVAVTPALDQLPEPDGSDVATAQGTSTPGAVVAPSVEEPAVRTPAASSPAEAGEDDLLDQQRRLVAETVTDDRSGTRPAPRRGVRGNVSAQTREVAGQALHTGTDGPATPAAPASGHPVGAAPASARAKRGQRPQMPSWEDVLLGTRR